MALFSIEELKRLKLNRYEAVIIASRHARELNTRRMAQLEKLEIDPSLDIESRKIPHLALKDLLNGEVKYTLPDSM